MNRQPDASEIVADAVLSRDGRYRYHLSRRWGDGPQITFVMLNPSTADAHSDDRTLRRCIGFTRSWGYDGLTVVNLYALRSTDPAALWRADDPIGPENDRHLADAAARSELLVAAWGTHARRERVQQVLAIPGFDRLTALRVTARGAPAHPLYLPRHLTPAPWRVPTPFASAENSQRPSRPPEHP